MLVHHGEYRESKFDGLGSASNKKFKYTGHFRNGRKHGKGQYLNYEKGLSFIGSFRDD